MSASAQSRPKSTSASSGSSRKRGSDNSSSSPSSSRKRQKTSPQDEKHEASAGPTTGLATTFGVEIELVLAFHKSALQSALDKHGIKADIVKKLTQEEHRTLLKCGKNSTDAFKCRSQYPMWALHVGKEDHIIATEPQTLTKGAVCAKSAPGSEKTHLRRYVLEPLLIAKERFDSANLNCNVVGWMERDDADPRDLELAKIPFPGRPSGVMIRQGDMDYSQWTVTNDFTLIGALPSQLRGELSKKIPSIPKKAMEEWDSYGLELVTPCYQLNDKQRAFTEIRKILKALETPRTTAFGSVWAKLHVHVGFDVQKPEELPILTLQHIAYILLQHEYCITDCFPRGCSGEDTDSIPDYIPPRSKVPHLTRRRLPPAGTIRDVDELEVLRVEREYTGVGDVNSNASLFSQETNIEQDHEGTLKRIFVEGGDIYQLINCLQQGKDIMVDSPFRGFMYNWANLWAYAKDKTLLKPKKPTIEFRQHDATVDYVVIKHWVVFLEAIVRKAEEKARQSTRYGTDEPLDLTVSYAKVQGAKYPDFKSGWPCENIQQFCVDFLGLPAKEGRYWKTRQARHVEDRPSHQVPKS